MSQVAAPSRLAVLLFTDIVDSAELQSVRGTPAYARLLRRHNELFETSCARFGGKLLGNGGDGYFAEFRTASDAVRFALVFQVLMRQEPWEPQPICTRIGIHSGQIAMLDGGSDRPVGLAVVIAARVMSLAQGGQILLTKAVFDDARGFVDAHPLLDGDADGDDGKIDPDGRAKLYWLAHGRYRLKGCAEALEVFEVGDERSPRTAPGDSEKVKRERPADPDEEPGPWRPGKGLEIPTQRGWTLRQKLGEGGFGEVWLAENKELDSKHVFKFCFDVERLRSFRKELKLFRRMRDRLGYRNDIAKVDHVQLDQPPFLIGSEYAAGGNLAEWAEQLGGLRTIALERRLAIVAKVADAVAAAHSADVLHKDLKPENILIDKLPNGSIQPRICDFGIGSLSSASSPDNRGTVNQSLLNVTAEAEPDGSGAPMYLPPEVIAGHDFTEQGDVYALGVLLYQMVVGDLKRPLAEGWDADVCEHVLRKLIHDCVHGDPQRRLQRATSVAERLRDLPRARRARQAFVWLRRSGVAAALGAVLLLGWGFSERLQKDEAERQQRTLEAIVQFQRDWLSSANPAKRGGDVRVVDVMTEAVKWLNDGALQDDPLVGAAVRASIGDTLRSLGKLDEAGPLLEEALRTRIELFPPDHPGIAQSRYELALLRHDQALALLDQGQLEQATAKFALAEALHRQALQTHARPGVPRFSCLAALGVTYIDWGRYADAEPVLTEAVTIGRTGLNDRRQQIATTLYNLAIALGGQDKYPESAKRAREALECNAFSETDPRTGRCLLQLAWCLECQAKAAEGEASYGTARAYVAEAKDSYGKARAIFLAHGDEDRVDRVDERLHELERSDRRLAAYPPDPLADAETARFGATPITGPSDRPVPTTNPSATTAPVAARAP